MLHLSFMETPIMRFLCALAIVFFVLFTSSEPSFAAPAISSVSSTWSHGSTVTITGSGFGAKSTTAPVVWDNASTGTLLTDNGKWSGYWPNRGSNMSYITQYHAPMRGIALPHNNITRYIAGAHGLANEGYDAGYNVMFWRTVNLASYPFTFYVSWYQMVDPTASPLRSDWNFKTFDWSSGGSPYAMNSCTNNNWYLNYAPSGVPLTTSTSSVQHQLNDDSWGYSGCAGSLQNPDVNGHGIYWTSGKNPFNYWMKMEMEVRITNQSTGYIRVWEDGAIKVNYAGRTDAWALGTRSIGIGGYSRDYGPNHWRYFADVYLDYTPQRVVLANNANIDNATIKEVQIPTAWSDGSITATVNRGRFTSGTAYVFVYDSVSATNPSGYSISLSGGGTTYTVTPSAGANGSISPNTAQTVSSGSAATFSVTANSGYTATVGGTCGGSPSTGTGTFTYTTSAISANCTVAATFSAITTYTVTPSAGSNGSISPNTTQTVSSGATTSFTVTPNSGYTASVGGTCGGSLVGTTYTTNAITANCTVSATFSALPVPAFPGAQGAGAVSVGGRGGAICEVTNLNNTGVGSLRSCIEMSGPRTVVFRVGGTIELYGGMAITNPYITIAGQTAPGGGILLSGKTSPYNLLDIRTHDVIIRYVKFRKGYYGDTPTQGGDSLSADQLASNSIVDHCSMSWTQDENSSIWGNSSGPQPHDITYAWSIFAEPLSEHPTNAMTGSNGNASENMTNIDFHHNLFANSGYRNPIIKNKTARVVNNIIYNWSYAATQLGGGVNVDVIGNLYKAGPLWGTFETPPNTSVYEIHVFGVSNDTVPLGDPSLYAVGNIGPHNADPSNDNWVMTRRTSNEGGSEQGPVSTQYRRTSPLPALSVPITEHPVTNLESLLLPTVGASRRLDCQGNWVSNRDAVDTRIIQEYNTNVGIIPTTENDVGGYPVIAGGTACADTDHDGMPDTYETANGLNPSNAADRNSLHVSGYTNLEVYLAGSSGTTYTVTPGAGANGSISPNTAQTVNSGATTAFTVTANSGYTASVGGTCGGSLVGTTYTTNAIVANCTVVASFCKKLSTPTGLNVSSFVQNPPSNITMTYNWNAVTTHTDSSALTSDLYGYRLYWGTTSGGPYNTALTAAGILQVGAGPTQDNIVYYAKIAAESTLNTLCNSDLSSELIYQADATPPTTPATLTATASSSTQINLSWGVSTDAIGVIGYNIERCAGVSCSNFAEVQITTGASTTYNNTSLTPGTVYRYRVRSRDAKLNYSGYSPIASATTPAVYTVTPSAGVNGAISPNTPQIIDSGLTTIFTVTPNSGYTSSVGGTCGGTLVGTTYTTNVIVANCTVSATFADIIPPATIINTTDPSVITTGSLSVIGTASDNIGVSGCKWRIGAAPNGSNGAACTGTTSFSCATNGYLNGSNRLYVGCYDAAANYGSNSIVVNYVHILPVPSGLRIIQ